MPTWSVVVTVDFSEVAGGTLVRLVQADIPDVTVQGDIQPREIIQTGWTEAFGKLGGFLGAGV
jgi:hypothetical protein